MLKQNTNLSSRRQLWDALQVRYLLQDEHDNRPRRPRGIILPSTLVLTPSMLELVELVADPPDYSQHHPPPEPPTDTRSPSVTTTTVMAEMQIAALPPPFYPAGSSDRKTKMCFVTVGATAAFDELIEELVSERCLKVLVDLGYTWVTIQCGYSGAQLAEDCFKNLFPSSNGLEPDHISVAAFNFTDGPMTNLMRYVKAGPDRDEGMIITHAGEYLQSCSIPAQC
jgi:hypothetical protein